MFTNESRAELKIQHPEMSDRQIELILCCHFGSEICKKLTGPSDWLRDPKTLLSNLRYLEQWRSVMFSGDPKKIEKFTIHREKSTLFMELGSIVQKLMRELNAVQAKCPLPVSTDQLETLWQNLERAYLASDDASDETQTAAYTVWRILKNEILTMEEFCKLDCSPPSSNPWKQAREQNSKITISDQMLTLFKDDDSIVDRKKLCAEVARILDCSSQAVRAASNPAWKFYKTEQARRKEIRKELKGKRWTDSEQNNADD